MPNTRPYLRISLTTRCNYDCYFCHKEGSSSKNNDLTVDTIIDAANIAKKYGVSKINLTGGEPLLRKDIVEIASKLHSINPHFVIGITTNGYFLRDYAKALKRAGVNKINVSLNSVDGGCYRSTTKVDGLERAVEGIDESLDAGLRVKVNTIMTTKNLTELKNFVEFCKKRAIPLRILDLLTVSPELEDYKIPLDEINLSLMSICSGHSLKNQDQTNVASYNVDGAEVTTKINVPGKKCIKCYYKPSCGEGIYALRLNTIGRLQPCLFRKDLELEFESVPYQQKERNFRKAMKITLS